jgi:pimeloyl-ACP methyl ester carboxylesterase
MTAAYALLVLVRTIGSLQDATLPLSAANPYQLSVTANDVSFDGLARTVAHALQHEGVESAIVVAHAHASGIGLRLAAHSSGLVTNLVLLDAGVVASSRSVGVAGAMRIASLVARFPGGRGLIRGQLISGIRANSGDARWVSDAIGRAYADPLIEALPAVARMAARLAEAQEPEPLERVLSRVRTDVTALIGDAPHEFGASEDELVLLQRIPGARLRRLGGVGHFLRPSQRSATRRRRHARRRLYGHRARWRLQSGSNISPRTAP